VTVTGSDGRQSFTRTPEIAVANVKQTPAIPLKENQTTPFNCGKRDPVQAYVWFNRAAAARNVEAVREREAVVPSIQNTSLRPKTFPNKIPRFRSSYTRATSITLSLLV
jgi:hypothetical protein